MKKKVLCIGLGRMGYHMASHIAKSPLFSISVYNRTQTKMYKWLAENNGSEYDQNTVYDYVVMCVGNDDDVTGLLHQNSAFQANMSGNTIVIDHTTTSAELAKTISQQLKEKNIFYLDAPVSGGEAGAIHGKLSCMVGGDEETYHRASSLIECYSHNVIYIGESGAGQVAKMANQLCIAGTLAGLSEAITFIKKEGVNTDRVFDAIKGGAAQSWQMDNRFKTMVNDEFDFGFAIDHMIKDLKYSLAQVKKQGWDPVIAQQVLSFYEALSAQGHSSQDTSVLIKSYTK